MVRAVRGFLMSLGMFSAIPTQGAFWDEGASNLVIPCLPAVGLTVGAIWLALSSLLLKSHVPALLQSAAIMLCPYILTGFIHLDGFMDTADAIFSRRGVEDKRRILKDPNAGAFAVAVACSLFVLMFAAVHTIVLEGRPVTAFLWLPAVTRGISGLALFSLRHISQTGYAAMFGSDRQTKYKLVLSAFTVGGAVGAWFTGGGAALAATAVAALFAIVTVFYTYRQLDGISGDLCGCVITVGEAAGVLCIALWGR